MSARSKPTNSATAHTARSFKTFPAAYVPTEANFPYGTAANSTYHTSAAYVPSTYGGHTGSAMYDFPYAPTSQTFPSYGGEGYSDFDPYVYTEPSGIEYPYSFTSAGMGSPVGRTNLGWKSFVPLYDQHISTDLGNMVPTMLRGSMEDGIKGALCGAAVGLTMRGGYRLATGTPWKLE